MTSDKFIDSVQEVILPGGEVVPVRSRVRRSTAINELAKALIQAQKEFAKIIKDKDNDAFKRNGRSSKYADLESVIDATLPHLNKNGLTILQHVLGNDAQTKETTVTTCLVHESGQYWESDLSLPSVNQQGRFDPQSVASASTYARRYAWQGITGTAATDDDANAASGVGTKEAATAVGEQKVKDLEAAKRAKQQGNGADLTKTLADSIAAVQTAKPAGNGHSKPSLDEMLQAAKEADLFDEISGTLLEVKDMKTTPAQGNRPFKRLVIATDAWGEIKDMEVSSFDNLTLSDGHLWENLIPFYINSPITILVEKRESKGKTYYNLRDIKKLGQKSWDQRLASIQNEAR